MAFRLHFVEYDGLKINLVDDDNLERKDFHSGNYCTVLIGRNGTGKSRLLAVIAEVFRIAGDDLPKKSKYFAETASAGYSINDEFQWIAFKVESKNMEFYSTNAPVLDLAPSRVIATTLSPFDKFPFDKRPTRNTGLLEEVPASQRYVYMGLKTLFGVFSGTARLTRVVEGLIYSLRQDPKNSRLSEVFNLLGYKPRLRIEYSLRIPKILRQLQLDQAPLDVLSEYIGGLSTNNYGKPEETEALQIRYGLIEFLKHENNKNVIIDADFQSNHFDSGSLELFFYAKVLRKFGLCRLRTVFLTTLKNQAMDIANASSGEQSVVLTFLGIASQLEDNSIVLLDEPELSLHPSWQQEFVPLMFKIFDRYNGCHFIIATHSPQILSRAGNHNCSVISMDDSVAISSEQYAKRSADYQLAELFDAPGYRNEYLAREALSTLRMLSHLEYDVELLKTRLILFSRVKSLLAKDDPVTFLIECREEAVKEENK